MSIDEKLRGIYETAKQREAMALADEERAAVFAERSFLGRTILSVSRDLTPTGYKFINLGVREAGKAPLQAAYELPDDFPFDDLTVRVSSNYDSWTNWKLNSSGLWVAGFAAVASGIDVDPETLMSWSETEGESIPVTFEDDNYQAIRLIATCFSTDIAAALNAEGS
jgi:hypothetical protein